MDTIAQENATLLAHFADHPPDARYIAGLLDGDGTLFIRKIRDGYQSGLSLAQSRTHILQILQRHFGGTIVRGRAPRSAQSRTEYTWFVRSYEYQTLLRYLVNTFLIKATQFELLHEFSLLANRPGLGTAKEELCQRCLAANACHNNRTLRSNHLAEGRLTIAYVAGLFDAEGCVWISCRNPKKFYVSITQTSCPGLLHALREMLQLGTVDKEDKWKLFARGDILAFVDLVLPYAIIKHGQLLLMKSFLLSTDRVEKQHLAEQCRQAKHLDEDFIPLKSDVDACKTESVATTLAAASLV